MGKRRYRLSDFDFELPPDLIAQHPTDDRGSSRLFVLDRKNKSFLHTEFSHLVSFLRSGDLLVFNDVKVISARISCRRKSGGIVEILLTRQLDARTWTAITNRSRRLRIGESLYPIRDEAIEFRMAKRVGDAFIVETSVQLEHEKLSGIADLALPPYIKRAPEEKDRDRYQTVFARESGAVAAPTAGLHFTPEMFEAIRSVGAKTVFLTLYVSWGTFQPVRTDRIEKHVMHSERYLLNAETAETINLARKDHQRIIAVGTTSLRVLESTYRNGVIEPGAGDTDIFIYPPRTVKSINALITNFHTPRSTLIMLVASFAGYDLTMSAYREAVIKRYRFFSYGDAMLII